jgi:polar amino acid transport system substrate-binding protein
MKKLLIFALLVAAFLQASAKDIIVNTSDISPFCFEEDGKPKGIAVDILNEAGKSIGVTFVYRFLPWKRAQMETRSAADHAIIPLTRTAEREKDYQWLAPLFDYNFVIVTRGDVPTLRSTEEARHLSVGVLRGNPMEHMLPQMGFTNVKPGTSEGLLARQLHASAIEAWVVADLVARDTYRKAGGNPDELRIGTKVGEPMRIYLGASPQFPKEFQKLIADEIGRLKNAGVIDGIVNKYRRQ